MNHQSAHTRNAPGGRDGLHAVDHPVPPPPPPRRARRHAPLYPCPPRLLPLLLVILLVLLGPLELLYRHDEEPHLAVVRVERLLAREGRKGLESWLGGRKEGGTKKTTDSQPSSESQGAGGTSHKRSLNAP